MLKLLMKKISRFALKLFINCWLVIALDLFLPFCSHAQSISKISGKSILLQDITESQKIGSEWLTVNEAKRKTGLIKIKQVRGAQAVAEILDGTVFIGQTLLPKPPPVSRFEEDPDIIPISQPSSINKTKSTKYFVGALFGYSMDNMSFLAGDANNPPLITDTVNLRGTHFDLKGYYDSPYNDKWTIRYTAGLDGFAGNYDTSKTVINKDNGGTSNVTVSTYAFEAEAMWTIDKTKLYKTWIGGGYSFQYTSANSTNMYSLSMSSSYSNVIMIGGGADFVQSSKYTMPIFFNYNTYLAGKGITQTSMVFGIGIGWPTSSLF